jgi:hypothetical protein
MPTNPRDFAFVEAQLRKMTFGVLSTINPGGSLQTTGILYGLSRPGTGFRVYLMTEERFLKVRNIRRNPEVSFLVPYPHHFFRFVPASCISFPGTAEIVRRDAPEAREAFLTSRILRGNLEQASSIEGVVYIEIRPKRRMHCYGLGFGLLELMRNPAAAGYSVEVPAERL